MRSRFLIAFLIAEIVFWIQTGHASAHPVMNEVMWAGSDISSSDEWLELTLQSSDLSQSLAGWSITYLKSTGQEATMITFPASASIEAGQYLVIGNGHAENSRLLSEPTFVTASLTLPNSALRLRLRDQSGAVIDEVDDGVGVPFAGANSPSPGFKASMERIDLNGAGTLKDNWRTATTARGLDAGAKMFATPGFENGSADPSSENSSSSSSSQTSSFSSTSSCAVSFIPSIILQSGAYGGMDKVTLNVQAGTTSGSLTGLACHFDFGDGFSSDSCNPGVHSYDHAGVFTLSLELKNQCGITLSQTQIVTVTASQKTGTISSSAEAGSQRIFDGGRIVISGVLPNPETADKDKEWIELKNLEDHSVPMAGWHLAVGKTSLRRYLVDKVPELGAHESIRLYQLETGIEIGNGEGRVELVNPQGLVVSSVGWKKAEEGRIYLSDRFKDQPLFGIAERIVDPETFDVTFDGPSSLLIGLDRARVRLLGVKGFSTDDRTELIVYQHQFIDLLRTLLENKKVELLFDTDPWDNDGNLEAYVMIEDGRIVQKELLLSGLATADVTSLYRSRQEYLDAQKKAMNRHAGIWSVLSTSSPPIAETARYAEGNQASFVDFDLSSSGRILLTEVYASPQSVSKGNQTESVRTSEWLELFNPEPHIVSLKGWTLTIGKKPITFGPASTIGPARHMILFTRQVGLKLKNKGDTIQLKSSNKKFTQSIDYQEMSSKESYQYDEQSELWCISKSPTAGEAGSCEDTADVSSKFSSALTLKKQVTLKEKKSKTARRTVYDKYAIHYQQSLQQDESQTVALAPVAPSSMQATVTMILGILMGSAGSLLTFSSSKVRQLLYA